MLVLAAGLFTGMNWWKTRRSRQLDRIETLLQQLIQGQNNVNQQIADILAALNTNTNTIAANTDVIKAIADAEATEVAAMQTAIAGLKSQIAAAIAANQAPTQDQLDALSAVNARLNTTGAVLAQISSGMSAASDALKSLGSDPSTVTTTPAPAPTPAAPAPAPTPDPTPAAGSSGGTTT